MPWLTTRSWHTTIARDPPDRTTTEWLHQARRYDGAHRASIEDVKNAVTREYRLTAVFRVRTFHCLAGMGSPIMLNALPAAEDGSMTCIDEH